MPNQLHPSVSLHRSASRRRRILVSTIAAAVSTWAAPAFARTLNWDANGSNANAGGTGVWDLTTPLWEDGVGSGNYVTWDNAIPDAAVFPAFGGVVTLGSPMIAAGFTVNAVNYTFDLNGNNLTLNAAAGGSNLGGALFRNNNSATTATFTGSLPSSSGARFTGNLNVTITGSWTPNVINDITGNFTFRPAGNTPFTLQVASAVNVGTASSVLRLDSTAMTAGGTASAVLNFSPAAQVLDFNRNIEIIHGSAIGMGIRTNGAKEITLSGTVSGGTAGGLGFFMSGGGQGHLILAGNNTYVGSTTMTGQANMLTLAHNHALGNSSGLSMGSTAQTIGFLGSITLANPAPISIQSNSANPVSGYGAVHNFGGHNIVPANITWTSGTNKLFGAEAGSTLTLHGTLGNATAGNGAGITKIGQGTIVLTAQNKLGTNNSPSTSNANATEIRQGTLLLDFSQAAWETAPNVQTNIINHGVTTSTGVNQVSHLVLGGGTLEVKGKPGYDNTQNFKNWTTAGAAVVAAFTVNSGDSRVVATQNGATSLTINLGKLFEANRKIGGTVDFTLPLLGSIVLPAQQTGSVGTSDTILAASGVAFATVGNGSDWAALDAARNITGGASILGFYTVNTASDLAGNADMSGGDTTLSAPATLTSLRFNNPGGRNIVATGQTLTTGGILVTPPAGPGLNKISGGTLQSAAPLGAPNQDLTVFQNNTAGVLEISSVIPDVHATATAFTKSGPGTLILSGANTYTGETHLNGGVTLLQGAGAFGPGKIILQGGVIGVAGGTTFTRAIGTTGSVVQWVGSGGFAAYGGDATVNLGGSAAQLSFGVDPASPNGFVLTGYALILGAKDSDATITFANPIRLLMPNAPMQREIHVVKGSNNSVLVDARLAGGIAGTPNDAGLTKTGNGTLEISAASAYPGMTVIEGGTLRMGVSGAVPNNTILHVKAGIFDLNSLGFSTNNAFVAMGGGPVGTTSVIDSGSSTFNLNTNFIYHGNVAHDHGATITGNLSLGAATRTFTVHDSNATNDDLVISAPITGTASAGLTKQGPGTLVLSGPNNYPGATTVANGTLVLNGSILSSTVSVLNGGTLAGEGSLTAFGGVLTAASGGTVAPGDGVGILHTSSVVLNSGSTLALEITNAATFDRLDVDGAFTLDGVVNLTLSLAAAVPQGSAFTVVDNDDFDPVNLLGISFGFAYNSVVLSEGDTFTVTGAFGSQPFQISYAGDTGNDVVLTAVPEPGSAVLLLGGLASLAGLRRRRGRD